MAIREETRTIKVITKKCPKCPRVLKARTEEQMKFNMDLHLEKHKKEEQEG